MSTGWTKIYPPGTYRGRDGWHIRGKDQYGRTIEGRLPPKIKTARAAERLGQQLLKESNRRPPPPVETPPPPADDHSFEAAAKAYRRIRRPRAVDWERIEKLIACPEIGPIDVRQLTTDQVATYATAAMPKNAPDTLNREIVTPYSAVLHYAHELGWRDEPTIRRFQEQEDEVRAITPAEANALVAHADATATYKVQVRELVDDKVAYKIAALEYLRLPETRVVDLIGLKHDDLDPAGSRVEVQAGEPFNRVEWRPVTPAVMARLTELEPCPDNRRKDRGDVQWVFPWRAKAGFHDWLRPLAAEAGVEATPRMYRHAETDPALDAGLQRMIAILQSRKGLVRREIRPVDRQAAYKVAFLEFLRVRGTRISDVLKLRRDEDLDLPGARIRLTIGKARDKVRWLPLTPKLVALFATLPAWDGVWLFPWRSKSGVYAWWNPLCERLGIKVTPHQFRHALGEEAMDADIDIVTLMGMGAWSSLNSARRYARASRKRLQDADARRAEIAGSDASAIADNVMRRR